ncbi:MAG: hypothetical protein V7K67_27880 [Nostoc sp.]|uniref:hypothetical protein n=1 Tax=Nostoc sp. TaxID=1180 RepID=UPI002FF9267B
MFERLKEFFSPVEETTTAQEMHCLSAEPLSRKEAERLALSINVGVARQKKADKNAL